MEPAKKTLSFGFSKKAEPKRVVEALKQKTEERKEVITAIDAGEVKVEAPTLGNVSSGGPIIIPCKNPLQGMGKRAPPPPRADGEKEVAPKVSNLKEQAEAGGLISRNISKLSAEDAEAMRELLKDAAVEGETTEELPAEEVAPILARKGVKRAREEAPAEATKEMFENVSVSCYGEAMLRGMGYDPNKHKTKPVYRDKMRDTYLGLGAKAMLPGEALAVAKKRKKEAAESAAANAEDNPQEEPHEATQGTDASAAAGSQSGAQAMWPSRGLLVRVISKREEMKACFGKEGVVLAVDAEGRTCQVKARVAGKSEVFSDIREEELETRVSRECKEVRIVKGSERGRVVPLKRRDVEHGVGLVTLNEKDVELPLEDLCQFMM